MRILVADRNSDIARILRDMLGSAGHEVQVVYDGVAALSSLRNQRPDVAILDAQLPLRGALDLLRTLQLPPNSLPIMVTTDTLDARLEEAGRLLGITHFVVRPFDVFALIDRIEKLRTVRPIAVSLENFNLLSRLWRSSASGRLSLLSGSRYEDALFATGGPVGPEALSLCHRALEGGQLRFTSELVESSGSRALLTDSLFQAAVRLSNGKSFGPERIFKLEHAAVLRDLPLSPTQRSIAARIGTRFSAIGLENFGPATEIQRLLGPLLALGIISEESATSHHSLPSGLSRRSIPPPAEPTFPPMPSVPPTAHEVSFQPQLRTDPNLRATNAQVTIPTQTDSRPGFGRAAVSSALHHIQKPLSVEQQRNILTREWQTLQTANAWTTLGIQPSAPPDRIQAVGERMVARYQALVQSSDPEISRIAEQILYKIETSLSKVREHLAAQAPATPAVAAPVAVGEDEPFFLQGQSALQRQQWALADRYFAQARDHSPGSARNLAYLGWARSKNNDLPKEKAEEEGMALLRLAEQFDPDLMEARWFLAQLLLRRGDIDAAERRLRKAQQLAPDHPELPALARLIAKAKQPAT